MTSRASAYLGDESNLARRIRLLREERGWSEQELIRRMAEEGCEVPINAIGRIESGRRHVRFNEALAIARVFDLTLDELATLLPLVQNYRDREALLSAVRRVERLFVESEKTARALVAYLSVLARFDEDSDVLVKQFTARVQRRVRAMAPSESDPDGGVYKATINHLGELMMVAIQRHGSTNLLKGALEALQLSRLFPPREREPFEDPSVEAYHQSLVSFAENDPEGFQAFAEEERREDDALFPIEPAQADFWRQQVKELNAERVARGQPAFELPFGEGEEDDDDGEH